MSKVIVDEDRRLAAILWDYHVLAQELPESVDLVLVAGSHDLRVADRAAELMREGVAPLAVASGGFGKVTSETNAIPEGQIFRNRMIELGVPDAAVLVEGEARNSGDNFVLSRNLLHDRKYAPASGIVVTKPYMERRALATGTKQWSEVKWWSTSPALGFQEYPTDDVPEDRMINLMVGDLQRMRVFAEKGFQSPQEVPDEVWDAYESLVERGFDQFVIR